jgi:hypothetical protein
LNQGRLDFLLNLVEKSSDPNIFFVKRNSNNPFRSFYNNEIVNLDEHMEGLTKMIDSLTKSFTKNIQVKPGFYICNIITGECICWEYIWNSSIRDKCRHCHAAELYKNVIKEQDAAKVINDAKEKLVAYFRNKERILPANEKNYVIYQNSIENSFQEIIRLYEMQGKVLNKHFVFYFKIITKI